MTTNGLAALCNLRGHTERGQRWPSIHPLVFIITLQILASLALRNSAFQDEALYLYTGHEYLESFASNTAVAEPYQRYLSGLPYFYPILGGLLDALGGLELARSFSLLCASLAMLAVYKTSEELFGRESSIVAALLFAVQAPVIFVSRLATFDSLCLLLTALTLWMTSAGWRVRGIWLGPAIGLSLVLAVGAKYAAIMTAPSLLLLFIWQTINGHQAARAPLRLLLCLMVGLAVVAVTLSADRDLILGLGFTTTQRTPIFSQTHEALATRAIHIVGLLLVLALAGVCLLSAGKRAVALLLIGTALLAPAYHLYKTEGVSFAKHLYFVALFAAPVAGYGASKLASHLIAGPEKRWLWLLALCMVMFVANSRIAVSMFREWPNTNELMQVMRTQVRPASGRILFEESEIPRYYLKDIPISNWQWNGMYFFEYTDMNGQDLEGIDAYEAAVEDGYWEWVVYRYGPNSTVVLAIEPILVRGGKYELITTVPIAEGSSGQYWIWHRKDPGQ